MLSHEARDWRVRLSQQPLQHSLFPEAAEKTPSRYRPAGKRKDIKAVPFCARGFTCFSDKDGEERSAIRRIAPLSPVPFPSLCIYALCSALRFMIVYSLLIG